MHPLDLDLPPPGDLSASVPRIVRWDHHIAALTEDGVTTRALAVLWGALDGKERGVIALPGVQGGSRLDVDHATGCLDLLCRGPWSDVVVELGMFYAARGHDVAAVHLDFPEAQPPEIRVMEPWRARADVRTANGRTRSLAITGPTLGLALGRLILLLGAEIPRLKTGLAEARTKRDREEDLAKRIQDAQRIYLREKGLADEAGNLRKISWAQAHAILAIVCAATRGQIACTVKGYQRAHVVRNPATEKALASRILIERNQLVRHAHSSWSLPTPPDYVFPLDPTHVRVRVSTARALARHGVLREKLVQATPLDLTVEFTVPDDLRRALEAAGLKPFGAA